MPQFTSKDRKEVDLLIEEYLCSNLTNWLDLDDIIEIAFEVHKNRKQLMKKKTQKK